MTVRLAAPWQSSFYRFVAVHNSCDKLFDPHYVDLRMTTVMVGVLIDNYLMQLFVDP